MDDDQFKPAPVKPVVSPAELDRIDVRVKIPNGTRAG
jgi:hypothetical protein